MGEKVGGKEIRTLNDERIFEALSAKPTSGSEDDYANPGLPPLKLHDQLTSRTANDLSHLDSKVEDSYSDPFDECAVLPDTDHEEDPNERVITVRSCLVGAMMVALGASISQVSHFLYLLH